MQILEEEIAARRGFWRRQRKRDEELTAMESSICKELLQSEFLSAATLQDKLEAISEGMILVMIWQTIEFWCKEKGHLNNLKN